ncbi:hypothetical protein D3C76_1514460 [compost metagenome]|uniref:Uncharacterized protein n=1 Tax=Pseudomonas jinjuensis TaxID=198616 RepID=A0A1H0KC63_9PSED|nr:hypothetical protein [Pseudomonas jinjuensis]SDO53360.1 hypothetical protein SAMN05216193_112121 [Pseudomonas jinjuensis]
MMRILSTFLIATALLLSGCWDSESEQKAKEQEQRSKNFWHVTPPDRSKSKGY